MRRFCFERFAISIMTLAVILLVCPLAIHAQNNSQWPSISQIVQAHEDGQWVKYSQSQTAQGKTQTAFLWQTLASHDAGQLQVKAIMAMEDISVTPPADDAQGIRVQTQAVKLADPLPGLPIPPPAKVTKDQITTQDFTQLFVAGQQYSGKRYRRQIEMTLPGDMKLAYDITLWTSPDVPITGIVKQTATVSGAYQMNMSMEIVTTNVVENRIKAQAEADAKAYAIPSVGQPSDILQYSEKLAFHAWKLNSLGHAERTQMFSPLEAYHSQFAIAALEMGYKPWALKARQRVVNYQNNRYLTQSFERVMSLHGSREDLLKLGTDPKRVDQVMLEHIVADKAPYAQYAFDEYLKIVTNQTERSLRRTAVEAGLKNKELTDEQWKQLVVLFMAAEDYQLWYKSACLAAARDNDLGTLERLEAFKPDDQNDPWHVMAMAMLYSKRNDRSNLKPALDETIAAIERADSPSSGLSTWNQGDARTRFVELLKDAGDARYLIQEKRLYEDRMKTINTLLEKEPQRAVNKYTAPNIAKAMAINGEKDKAIAIITNMQQYEHADMVPVLVMYYAHAADKTDAMNWRHELKGDPELLAKGQGFRSLDLKAEAALGFAEHQRGVGNMQEYERWLDIALNDAVVANVQFVAFNKQQADSKDRAFWRTGQSLIDDAPYQSVLKHLLAHPGESNDSRLIKLLVSLTNEMPTSGQAQDAWRDAALGVAKAERRELLKEIFKYLPRDWQHNWYTAVIAEATIPVAAIDEDGQGNVAYVRELVAMQDKVNWKAEILRSAIVALANRDRILDAQELMADMKQLVAEGKAWAKHQSFATVAIAKALASRGLLDEALVAFNDRSTDLEENIPIRGVNGQNWANYLFELGREVGLRAASPDLNDFSQFETFRKWSEGIEDKRELAVILAGMARGYYNVHYAR